MSTQTRVVRHGGSSCAWHLSNSRKGYILGDQKHDPTKRFTKTSPRHKVFPLVPLRVFRGAPVTVPSVSMVLSSGRVGFFPSLVVTGRWLARWSGWKVFCGTKFGLVLHFVQPFVNEWPWRRITKRWKRFCTYYLSISKTFLLNVNQVRCLRSRYFNTKNYLSGHIFYFSFRHKDVFVEAIFCGVS